MDNKPKEPNKLDQMDYVQYKATTETYSVMQSFKYAFDGILDVFRTQKHMRFHFIAAVAVLLAALISDMSKQDILILLFTISLVLIAEMFNTALEAVVDMITKEYHPVAKFVKDAAAGAVLIATATAVLMALLLIVGDLKIGPFSQIKEEPPEIWFKIIVACVILFALVTIIKLLSSRGKLLKGGIISGHAAFGFFFAATMLYISRNPYIAVLGIMMALLVAQSRVQARIHSVQEVAVGAVLAMLLSTVIFWFFP
ncbi:MAG: diacylglycerol kinase [Armatimonadota bacterium]